VRLLRRPRGAPVGGEGGLRPGGLSATMATVPKGPMGEGWRINHCPGSLLSPKAAVVARPNPSPSLHQDKESARSLRIPGSSHPTDSPRFPDISGGRNVSSGGRKMVSSNPFQAREILIRCKGSDSAAQAAPAPNMAGKMPAPPPSPLAVTRTQTPAPHQDPWVSPPPSPVPPPCVPPLQVEFFPAMHSWAVADHRSYADHVPGHRTVSRGGSHAFRTGRGPRETSTQGVGRTPPPPTPSHPMWRRGGGEASSQSQHVGSKPTYIDPTRSN